MPALAGRAHVLVVEINQIAERLDIRKARILEEPLRSILCSISSARCSPSLRLRNVSAT